MIAKAYLIAFVLLAASILPANGAREVAFVAEDMIWDEAEDAFSLTHLGLMTMIWERANQVSYHYH